MIKYFQEFILELYNADKTDPPQIASDMNRYNELENQIKDFDRLKVTVNNIYMTYKDEKDLIDKLAAQKIIDKTDNKKKLKFHNPVLAIWAQSCDKRRDLKNLQDQIKDWKTDISDEQSNIKANPSSKDSLSANIKLTEDKIRQKTQYISKLQMEIVNLEKIAKDKLKVFKDDLMASKKRIDLYRFNKFTKK
jgi:hypothetical protein